MRRFSPNLVCSLGEHYLFVDHTQPVAALVEEQGSVRFVLDWRHLADTPRREEVLWPVRTLYSDGGTAWLIEESEGYCIEFTLDPTGTLAVSRRDDWKPSGSEEIQRSRFSSSGTVVAGSGAEEVGVKFDSTLHDFTWTASIATTIDSNRAFYSLGRGSVTSAAAGRISSALCLRNADKRPWSFNPRFDMYIVDLEEGDVKKVSSFDISDRLWRPHSIDLYGFDRTYFTEYLEFTHAECEALARHGATDVSYRVRQMDTNPLIEIWSHFNDASPGEAIRIDRPFDELGRRSRGLLGLGIFIDDDFTTDLIRVLGRGDGPTLI